ncbi:hypothetical protein PSUB009319_02540 [Ralstonia sp. SET104]|nr:hypothetical protein PSUB009319_02540 [Ralstonia sp. SET104]
MLATARQPTLPPTAVTMSQCHNPCVVWFSRCHGWKTPVTNVTATGGQAQFEAKKLFADLRGEGPSQNDPQETFGLA